MWPEDRRRQLVALGALLADCRKINTANCIVDRLQRIEALANELDTDGQDLEPSFRRWVEKEALR
jgi:hypothetical protein